MSSEKPVSKTGLTYFWSKIVAYIENIFPMIGNTQMGTTAQTITGAIKEHNDKIGDTTMGTTAETLTGAIAEHEQDISDLNSNLDNVTFLRKLLSENVNTDFAVPSNYRGLLIICDSAEGRNGIYHVWATGAGAVGYRAVLASSGMTFTTSTSNRLGLKPTSGGPLAVFMNTSYKVSVVS